MSLVVCLLIALAPIAAADDGPVRAAAVADAHRQLTAAIAALPVAPDLTLSAVLGRGGDASTVVAALSAGAQAIGTPRTYSDGTTEIHLALDRAALLERLGNAFRAAGVKDSTAAGYLAALRAMPLSDQLLVAGFASVQTTTRSAAGDESRLTRARDLAGEAAILDARRQAVDRLSDLRLADHRRLGELFERRPELESAVLRALPFSMFGPGRFTPGGECRISAKIGVIEALAVVDNCIQQTRDASEVAAPALKAAPGGPAHIAVDGIGLPPSEALLVRMGVSTAEAAPEAPPPGWALACISVRGESRVSESNQDRAAALAAALASADFDARRRIAERIDRLELPAGGTVRAALLAGVVAPRDLEQFLAGAERIGRSEVDADGRVQVTLRLPMRGLWRLLQDHSPVP